MLRLSTTLRILLSRSLATHATNARPDTIAIRHDWHKKDVRRIYDSDLMDLVFRAASVHRQFHDPSKIQLCTLMNIKSMYDTFAILCRGR